MEYVDKLPIAASRKKEWLNGKQCSCGSAKNLMIEYPNPKISFSVWMLANLKRREKELSKVKVWCADHYAERMSEKRLGGLNVTHGMAQMYRRGCRCAACKKAITEYQVNRLRNKKPGI